MNRYVHINTGTHGREDGSTVFWISDEVTQELLTDKDSLKDWENGANLFMNQDMGLIK
jgi:hypothetical protein